MATKPYKIVIKFPTRNRPDKFINCINNIFTHLADKVNTRVVVTADIDDATMFNKKLLMQVKPYMDNYNLEIIFGKSESKIHACNRDIELLGDWDIIMVTSDDMLFESQTFDYKVREGFDTFFPTTDGNLFFNDGFAKDRISTLPIVGRKYYERFGYIYHPSYKSLWCDNEYTEVARKLGKIAYYEQMLYRHHHPSNVGGYVDAQLMHTESFNELDKVNYDERKKRDFDMVKVVK
jgi:hypothetical protein